MGVVRGKGVAAQEFSGVDVVGRSARTECVIVAEPGRDAGMNDFLLKPFMPEQLFGVVLRALGQRQAT